MKKHDIAGKWRGNYQYHRRPDDGSSFNATFTGEGARFQGTIVDDYAPCEAFALGSFSFPSVQFTKVYKTGELVHRMEERNGQVVLIAEDYANAVEYTGKMDDDGQSMSGTWSITLGGGSETGFWTAHRLSTDEKKAETEEGAHIKELQPEEHNL